MKNSTLSKMYRTFAGIMAVMMFFVVLFSAIFIVLHSDHDCTGEDCPVCACLQLCESILHSTGDGPKFTASGVNPAILITGFVLVSSFIIISGTPVSAKVRMNN